ncbi:MAG: PAS domain S-box protein [Aulosira sp. ZfuVER01]|nr:PAS domain S-box protein [Aulosira sp. ZfuVER01]MDZ7999977.1 PAS domain S-box protein [Aulosira sp. DedVER01a]MDZ8051416.1 PAS domain S-box protein [Aulosira sp. ZfuCHP01]
MTLETKVNIPAARILLANNDAQMRDRLQQLLSQRYQLHLAVDGIDALTHIQQLKQLPELVIADLIMPRMDGLELLRSLRSNPQTQDITIILLSPQAEEELCITALEMGADDYLSQPFSDSQLLSRIKINLKMSRLRQATVQRQQQLQTELKTAKAQVTTILESMTDAFYSLDRDWCFTYINSCAERILGQPRHELLGKNIWEQYPVFTDTVVYQQYHRACAESVPINFEYYYQACDCWYDIHVYPSEEGINVYFQNISEQQAARRDRQEAEAVVRASQERLRSFFEANLVGILFGHENGSIVEANEEFLRIVGYSRADLQAGRLSWLNITPPEYWDLDELGIAEAKVKGTCTPYEKEFIRKDGSRVPVVVGYSLLREPRQQSMAFILDISSRKQTERALHQSEERFQAFMDNSPAAAWITDSRGHILYLSPTYYRTFQLSTTDAIGKTVFDLYPREIAQKFLNNIRKVVQTNQVVEAIELAPLQDGTMGDFLVYKFPITDPSGKCLVGGVAVDITERERALRQRQQAEQALQKHSERLKLLSETASDLLSTEHPLELMNDLFAKLSAQMDLHCYFNYLIDTQGNRQKLHLKSWSGIDDRVVPIIEWLEMGQAVCGLAAHTHRQIIVNNVQHSTHPNTEILCTLNMTAYAAQPLIARGKLLGVLSFGSRTRNQFTPEEIELLQATSDQIAIALERAELVVSLQQQTEQLIQANRLKDEFLAVLSHELRTPLNPILGWSKLLRTQKCDEATTTRALETIERNAKLQTELIEDLLDVSRILQGKLNLNITQVDPASTIAAAVENVQLAAEAKCIQLQVQLQPNVGKICGDRNRLQQVVWNLLSNAVKFTPPNGRIEIRLASLGSQVQLQVEDTGKGISPDFLPYVFDYFRQADSTNTRKFGGLGLGLAIVRHLVELHGGTVRAESPGEGQGATFTVTLPLIQTHLDSYQGKKQLDEFPDLNGVKVLVVDDDFDTGDLISYFLEQLGAEVTQVRSPTEALQVLIDFQPNVLLSNIGIPEIDGYTLIRQIRAMPPELGGQIPVIALTAYTEDIQQPQNLLAGFQTHITKPINPANLALIIAQAAGRVE